MKLADKLSMRVAWLMPRRIAYWALIRCGVEAASQLRVAPTVLTLTQAAQVQEAILFRGQPDPTVADITVQAVDNFTTALGGIPVRPALVQEVALALYATAQEHMQAHGDGNDMNGAALLRRISERILADNAKRGGATWPTT
jgi:hypothetical protein